MQRALILLNPCGREAGRHKLKNGLKTQKMHFLPVFELTLASLTAIWVEQNQCTLHQLILLTQGPIHEIFIKKYWELTKPWKWLLFSFLVFGFWLLGFPKIYFFILHQQILKAFIWGSFFFCTMDGFFRIWKKTSFHILCTQL